MSSKSPHNKGTTNLHDAIAEELIGEETVAAPLIDTDEKPETVGQPDGDFDMGAETKMVSFTPDMQRALQVGVTTGIDKLQPIPPALEAALDFGGKRFPLTKSLMIIGRVTEVSDIALPDDDQVSRHHAAVTYSSGAFFVEDLESTNGTFMEGKRIKRQTLAAGVEVRVGLSTFTLKLK